ncbi:MAG TPA: response regulator [Actinomycetota bacterium]|nr:response regulator [Actinomycetota bacterium]
MATPVEPIEILLVEDNPGDVQLTIEALKDGKVNNNLHVARDGVEAMEYLRAGHRPDVIFLDLNLPRMDGREVLQAVKGDDDLKAIPIVVLTTSESEEDVLRSYQLHANCYITKPVDFTQFIKVVQSIDAFWFSVVKLPRE